MFQNLLKKNSIRLLLLLVVIGSGCGEEKTSGNASVPTERKSAAAYDNNPMVAALLKRAEWANENHAFTTVLALCDQLDKHAPDFDYVYFLRGQALAQLNRHEEAGAALQKVLQLNPDFPAIRFHLGNNAAYRKRYREALEYYHAERADDAVEKKRARLLQMGRVHRELGEIEQARTAFNEAVRLDEIFHEAHDELGALYQEQGDLEKALAARMRALELQPENIDYAYFVGALLFQLGRPNDALAHLEKTKSKRPWFYGVHYNLGRCLLALGRKQEGKRHLSIADSLQKRNSELGVAKTNAEQHGTAEKWLIYADMLAHDGRETEALVAYQATLSLNPRDTVAAKAIAKLRQKTEIKQKTEK